MRIRTRLIAITAAIVALAAGTADSTTRYARLLTTETGIDSLKNLALWEDQRVTGDGKLFEYLASPDPLIRLRAVEVTGRLQDPTDVRHLVPLLGDAEFDVVRAALFALGQIGSEEAVAPIQQFMEKAAPAEIAYAAEALGKIGSDAAVDRLVELLRDFSARNREQAGLALARAGSDRSINALLLAVHDPDADVAWKAVYALGRVESERAGEKVVPFLSHEDPRVRMFAAYTVGKQKESDGLSQLTALLRDKDLGIATMAAWALGEIGSNKAAGPLGDMLGEHPSHRGRLAAAQAIGSIGHKKGKDALIRALSDPSVAVRAGAVVGLAGVIGKDVDVFAEPMLGDGERLVRAAAVEALGAGECKRAIDRLMKIAEEDDDALMRLTAVEALGKLDDERVAPFLVTRLGDDDWAVVTTAVHALGEREYQEGAPALVETYRLRNTREGTSTRKAVLEVLTEFQAPAGAEIAREALTAPDRRLRTQAHSMLAALGDTVEVAPEREINLANFDRARRRFLAPPSGIRHATIVTRHGEIELELFGDDAPQFVARFIDLAKKGVYEGAIFHRVESNFVVQGGDPRGDGWGDCGQFMRSQFNDHRYAPGYVGVPHDGKDTGDCQLFITHRPSHHLDGRYTIFGRVVRGMDVVGKIDRGDTFSVRVGD